MALIMLTFRFEQRACVIRRKRTFQLMTISMQTLKWLDIPTSYFTLRVTNSIPLVCCASSFTICCILSDGEAQQEGEWPTICSLLAVKHEINAESFGVREAMVLLWERETEQEDTQVCIQVRIPKNKKGHIIKMQRWYTKSFQWSSPQLRKQLNITVLKARLKWNEWPASEIK